MNSNIPEQTSDEATVPSNNQAVSQGQQQSAQYDVEYVPTLSQQYAAGYTDDTVNTQGVHSFLGYPAVPAIDHGFSMGWSRYQNPYLTRNGFGSGYPVASRPFNTGYVADDNRLPALAARPRASSVYPSVPLLQNTQSHPTTQGSGILPSASEPAQGISLRQLQNSPQVSNQPVITHRSNVRSQSNNVSLTQVLRGGPGPSRSRTYRQLPANYLAQNLTARTIGRGRNSGRNLMGLIGSDSTPRTMFPLIVEHARPASWIDDNRYPDPETTEIPAGTSLEEICRRYPLHVWGSGLRLFHAEGWTEERIYRTLPRAARLAGAKTRPWNYLQKAVHRQVLKMNEEDGVEVERGRKRKISNDDDDDDKEGNNTGSHTRKRVARALHRSASPVNSRLAQLPIARARADEPIIPRGYAQNQATGQIQRTQLRQHPASTASAGILQYLTSVQLLDMCRRQLDRLLLTEFRRLQLRRPQALTITGPNMGAWINMNGRRWFRTWMDEIMHTELPSQFHIMVSSDNVMERLLQIFRQIQRHRYTGPLVSDLQQRQEAEDVRALSDSHQRLRTLADMSVQNLNRESSANAGPRSSASAELHYMAARPAPTNSALIHAPDDQRVPMMAPLTTPAPDLSNIVYRPQVPEAITSMAMSPMLLSARQVVAGDDTLRSQDPDQDENEQVLRSPVQRAPPASPLAAVQTLPSVPQPEPQPQPQPQPQPYPRLHFPAYPPAGQTDSRYDTDLITLLQHNPNEYDRPEVSAHLVRMPRDPANRSATVIDLEHARSLIAQDFVALRAGETFESWWNDVVEAGVRGWEAQVASKRAKLQAYYEERGDFWTVDILTDEEIWRHPDDW